MKYSIFATIPATLVLFGYALLPVAAECCKSAERCGDGTRPTPCCGYGPCNVFCCNCDGGCRHNFNHWTLKGQSDLDTGVSSSCEGVFIVADTDGDGKLTFNEWFEYSTADKRKEMAIKWSKYDMEGKGYLTMEEAYERKV